MQTLLEEVLIPAARQGLQKCGIVEERYFLLY